MTRNTESRFATNPTRLDLSRSRFDRSSSVKLTFNAGELIPWYVDEVLPGDTFSIDTSKVIRMQTLLTPIMDNLYADFYWFFVPNRLVWQSWKQCMGENTQSYWVPTTTKTVPQIKAPATTGWNIGTVADYMGVPTGVPYDVAGTSKLQVSALPFRAYGLIYNEWFRDENLIAPLNVQVSDVSVNGNNTNPLGGGLPCKVAKYHDYFTSALPAPQKGPDVQIPLATASDIPVVSKKATTQAFYQSMPVGDRAGMAYRMMGGSTFWTQFPTSVTVHALGDSSMNLDGYSHGETDSETASGGTLYPTNLWAIQSAGAMSTIAQLRTAFQIQKFYERDARGGTRYTEILRSHFGVTSPDSRLQRPEYLGGNRVPININQVVQQSATTSGGTPQGTFTGVSQTSDVHSDFTHSFTEHGFIMGLLCVRYDHTYQQGLERFWSRKDRFDYYWPVFANLSEQAILNKEIYCDGTTTDDEVFGYQEAWADYRYKPNRVAGEMRSAATLSLDTWHLGDDYSSCPALSQAWIEEDKAPIDRVLAVQSSVSMQFFADIYVKNRCTRCMPLYSIPGLIDHH